MTHCPRCGSSAQFKLYGSADGGKAMIQLYICGCGYKHQIFWEKTAEAGWLYDKKLFKEIYKKD